MLLRVPTTYVFVENWKNHICGEPSYLEICTVILYSKGATYEPQHEEMFLWTWCLVKTRIRLCIYAHWSESLLCTLRYIFSHVGSSVQYLSHCVSCTYHINVYVTGSWINHYETCPFNKIALFMAAKTKSFRWKNVICVLFLLETEIVGTH